MKRKKSPTSVGDILSSLTRKTDLGVKIEQARIWENWTQIVGPTMAARTRPETVKDDVLHVCAASAVWMNRLDYAKRDIINNINELVGRELIADLFIRLAPEISPSDSQDGE